MQITEPTVITEGLPDGYRIIADEQDGRFYPQRSNGARFATRLDLGGGYVDHPISFDTEEAARILVEYDSSNHHGESWGSIVYTRAELYRLRTPLDIVLMIHRHIKAVRRGDPSPLTKEEAHGLFEYLEDIFQKHPEWREE